MNRGMVVLLAACAAEISPMSLEVHYSADAPPIASAGLTVGVARFTDARPRAVEDLHSASYVAHDGAYHLGLTWNGRTFASAAAVIQGLLVNELERAGIKVILLDAQVDSDDAPGAQVAARGCDVVLGGTIRGFAFNHPGGAAEPTVDVEVTLFEGASGKGLMHAPFTEHHRVTAEGSRQRHIDDLFDQSFRPVAHQIIGEVARGMSDLAAARQAAAAAAAAATPQPVVASAPSPEPAPEPPKRRRRSRR